MAERLGQLHRHLLRLKQRKNPGATVIFHKKQMEVINAVFKDGKKRVFARKGRKGGGTETSLYPVVRMAGLFPNIVCYIIYPTLILGKEIVWNNNRLKSFIPPEWKAEAKEAETRIIIPHEDGNSSIRIMGADNYKQMVGIEADVFVFDELKDHDPRAYKNCYPNIASRDALWFVLGAPPKNKNNFYYKVEMEVTNDPDWSCHHWSTWDNAENLPGGALWIQNEKDKYYRNGNWDEWEVEWEARYVFGGKNTVIPAFDREKHVVPFDFIDSQISKDRDKLRWYEVFDPGYSTCFHVMFAVINPYTTEVFILDEIHETNRQNLSIDQIWPRVRDIEEKLFPGHKWRRIYDSAAPGFPQEVRSRWPAESAGFRPTHKEEGDEDKYFRIINSIFKTNRCLVAEGCEGTIYEIENYLTKDDGTYPDEFNHALDDFRYLLKADNYRLIEKQNDVVVKVTDSLEGTAIEEDMRAAKNDWAAELVAIDSAFDFGDDL